uniref:E3 ubiquitin-protein ligase RNF144B n=1 Tax=Stomoxys calcitrans TaxID=35570 RepID=A0A1I8Q5J3_STOCA
MRPPMQKTALQQNEANRLQQQQQHQQQQQSVHLIPQKHLQQQKQQLQLPLHALANDTTTTETNAEHLNGDSSLITTVTSAASNIDNTVGHKSKLEQRELLVENHLNNACFAQVHHQQHQPPLNQLQPHQPPPASELLQHQQQFHAKATAPALTATVFYNDSYQQQQQQQPIAYRPPRPTTLVHRLSNIDNNCSGVKLVDLISTSPPHHEDSASLFRHSSAADVLLHNQQTNHLSKPTLVSLHGQEQREQHRYSYVSQYSRSSSSDDSSSLSLSTACGSLPGGIGVPSGTNSSLAGARNSSSLFSSYNNTFDDAAENFIINFPADTTPGQTQATAQSSTTSNEIVPPPPPAPPHSSSELYNYCLPLSETEPLLTNIEATVKDKHRSIYLHKNSASLIFTKKDLTAHRVGGAAVTTPTSTYQQHLQLQTKTNNNGNASLASLPNSASNTHSVRGARQAPSLGQHSTLRSFSEENHKRKPTKHLPATYHQQHRRSLQLNYNNNLVTTSTCGLLANNNHHHNHCCSNSNNQIRGNPDFQSNSAVLHKTHNSNQNYPKPQQQQQQHTANQQSKLQHRQQPSPTPNSVGTQNNTNSALANNTAAATRKQYAYSWYAPVYSALEEELEHDSRDSSPIHNLATAKKQNIHQYHHHHRTLDLNSSLSAAASDTEREALLETRNNINIQAHFGGSVVNPLKRDAITKQLTSSKLALQHSRNSSAKGSLQTVKGFGLNGSSGGSGGGGGGDIAAVESFNSYDLEGPHAGSLALAGGPQPRHRRFGNFLKSLMGLRPSATQKNAGDPLPPPNGAGLGETERGNVSHIPSSPEITITRTPSEQNMVVMRDPSGRQPLDYNVVYSSREKLANGRGDQRPIQSGGSTSSLNVMQQKLWNIMRREGSAISLHQEKSQSIVHYTGLRKCETVIALTRQNSSPCSPTLLAGAGCAGDGSAGMAGYSQQHNGSGIFSANGVEQIRPLNRLRNSVSSMNNTCSRCSSLLSLAASTSRYSLNSAMANPHPHHQHQHQQYHQPIATMSTTHFSQYQRNPSNVSSSNLSSTYGHSRDGSIEAGGLQFAVQCNNRAMSFSNTSGAAASSHRISNGSVGSRTPSITSPTTTITASAIKSMPPPPTENSLAPPPPPPPITSHASLLVPLATREDASFPMEKTLPTPLTAISPHFRMQTMKEETTNVANINGHNDTPPAGGVIDVVANNRTSTTNVTPSASNNAVLAIAAAPSSSSPTKESITPTILQCPTLGRIPDSTTTTTSSRPFELFTCKLCLIDVEDASNSTVLHQCGCQFCTECMKAYVEFEISEGAYEISCPDAQCPEQGAMTLPEIAMLTTTNLMKKHHRYRLNREIELDKTRTWCPRAGCETVCLIGSTISSAQTDVAPSTSSSAAAASTNASTLSPSSSGGGGGDMAISANTPLLCAVQCPSCKDEFCSACKKTWHPNITCEEHSRRLAADGQDDIGIPFDNDLIKCCPMCAVPIEKDEGCAQMMCKRCKHVFCWYCLASLDDDFLLRHYDKGPCKNKLGHSRASVVWHRAQVIGIFAGFGILLLVASPLLLLAAPCIICCKCRSCSGSKIDEGDVDMDEATALQR